MIRNKRTMASMTAALAILMPTLISVPAHAGFLKRHPVASGVAAGLIAHHMAKKSAKHGHRGFLARHPVATGVVTGALVHHHLKK